MNKNINTRIFEILDSKKLEINNYSIFGYMLAKHYLVLFHDDYMLIYEFTQFDNENFKETKYKFINKKHDIFTPGIVEIRKLIDDYYNEKAEK